MKLRTYLLAGLALLFAGIVIAQQTIAFKPAGGGNGIPVDPNNPLPVTFSPNSSTTTGFVRGYKLPASTGTPEALAADGTLVQSVTIWGFKAARTNNTTSAWIDSISTNDAQTVEVPAGTPVTITAAPGKVIDLNDIYVDITTAGDGVFYLAIQ